MVAFVNFFNKREMMCHDLIVCPTYVDAFCELTTAEEYSCVIDIIAVSSAVSVACDSIYPPVYLSCPVH